MGVALTLARLGRLPKETKLAKVWRAEILELGGLPVVRRVLEPLGSLQTSTHSPTVDT